MFMNKKGFAISVVLYTMVLLVIGIFYLLLGIVRNRYIVGNDLKNAVINGIEPGGPPITDLATIIEKKLPLTTPDIDGTRYVYGKTEDNYLWYSGKLWRIVSLNGDGSIKLVTQGNMTTIAWNPSNRNVDYSNSQARRWLNNEFLPTLYDANNLLVDATWDYTTYSEATTTKTETIAYVENEKVGLLTVYDFVKTGGSISSSTSNTFLNNGYEWWTASPQRGDSYFYVWRVDNFGAAYYYNPTFHNGLRPSVNLKLDIQITGGEGTKLNPYVIEGDKDIGVTSELLVNRISGEYINFNNVLYRIVGTEEFDEKKFIKITMADYKVNGNVLTTSLVFGSTTYSPTYGIGLYLEEWYQADGTNETYADSYIKDAYKAMIATSTDGVVWYTGPTSGIGTVPNYTLSKTGTPVSATIGLGYYGEMFSSHFGDGYITSSGNWLMTKYSSSYVWRLHDYGYVNYYFKPTTSSYGVRPSMYLKSNVKITGGAGMPHNPYTLTQ